MGLQFLAFWPCGPSFPCILALWACISFHFGLFGLGFWGPPTSCQKWSVCPTSLQWIYQRRDRLHFAVFSILGLHFLAFWPFGPSFPFILAFWAFISFHFGLLGLHFLSFWHFGPSFPFILAFWAFILHFGLVVASLWPPPTSCQKRTVFPMSHIKNLAAPGPASFSNFWPFGPSFPFILAFWAFISFHFGLLGLHLAFWPCGSELVGPPHKLPKTVRFPNVPSKEFSSARPGFIFQFLAFWAFISFHFGLLGLHFLSFWPFGPSFPFILAFWAFILHLAVPW